jgi:4-hydroxybenzoate polyprenyltransferase
MLRLLKTVRPYLELMRVPNVFTSMADIFAGYFAVTQFQAGQITHLIFLLFSTSFLYTAGIIFNDYFDYETDLKERPQRPLPSGRVDLAIALTMGIVFIVMGMVFAGFVGTQSFVVAALLAGAILAYDSTTKNIPALGSINMGSCRFLNVLLGMSAVPGQISSKIFMAFLVMIYVISITALSKGEVQGGKQRGQDLATIGVALVILGGLYLWIQDMQTRFWPLVFLLVFAIIILRPLLKVLLEATPSNIKTAVKTLVLSIILLDAFFTAGFANVFLGLLVLALLIPSVWIARFLYVT